MRASRQHRIRPQTPAVRQFAQRLKIFSDYNKERLNDDAFGKFIPPAVALLGFCGAPWTLATYMVAGQGTPDQFPATGYATACEAVAKDTEKSNNLVGKLSVWRASHQPAAALATSGSSLWPRLCDCAASLAGSRAGLSLDVYTSGAGRDRYRSPLSRSPLSRSPMHSIVISAGGKAPTICGSRA
jgi:hypothetical protein